MENFAKMPPAEPQQDKKIEEEKTRGIISLLYENIENLKKGEEFNQDLAKKLPAGKDILRILRTLGQADIMPFLLKFKEKTHQTTLVQIPKEASLISLLKEGKGYDPSLIELGLILDSLKMKFHKDVIADILRRDYLEKQLSELGPKMPSIDQELLICGKAHDDLKILMFKKDINLADFKSLSAEGKEQYNNAQVKFDDIAAALDREIFRAAKKEDEYKNLKQEQYQKLWSRLENLDNAIAKAKTAKIEPLDFFQKRDLRFLFEIFNNRFDSLTKMRDKLEQLSKEYLNKYII